MISFIKYKHPEEIRLIQRALNEIVKDKLFVTDPDGNYLKELLHQVQKENGLQISDIYTKEVEIIVNESKLKTKYLKLVTIKDLEFEFGFRDGILSEYLMKVSNMIGLDIYGHPIVKLSKSRLRYWLDQLLTGKNNKEEELRPHFHRIIKSDLYQSLEEITEDYDIIKNFFNNEIYAIQSIILSTKWGIAKINGDHAFSRYKQYSDKFLTELEESEEKQFHLLYYAIINNKDLRKAFEENKLHLVYQILGNE